MAIPSYTTEVPADKTADEIKVLLRKWKAREITELYSDSGVFEGIRFVLGEIEYRFVCNVEGVYKALQDDATIPASLTTKAQAERVGWRNMLGWFKYSMAAVEMGLFDREQVLMPYHLVPTGQTLWQVYQGRQLRLEVKGE